MGKMENMGGVEKKGYEPTKEELKRKKLQFYTGKK